MFFRHFYGQPMQDETNSLMENLSSSTNVSMYEDDILEEPHISLLTFEFIVHGLLILFIGFCGIIGNILCLLVLCQRQMRNSINCLLIGLAVIDISLIVSAWLMFSLPAFQIYFERRLLTKVVDVYQYSTPFVYPLGMIAQTASVYLTVLITLERYFVVCLPLKSRSLCTYGRARRCVVVIMVCSCLYNVPRFFEYKFETFQVIMPNRHNVTLTFLQSTMLRDNSLYISIYMTWLYMIFMYVVPFSFLFVLNSKIAWEIRSARKKRSQMTIAQQAEEGLAIMLLVIVCTFMLCNAPAMVSNIMEALQFQAVKLTQVSNLLIVINSSVNIIVYVIFCKKFRIILSQKLCRQPRVSRVLNPLLRDENCAANPQYHNRVIVRRNRRQVRIPTSQSLPLVEVIDVNDRAERDALLRDPRKTVVLIQGHLDKMLPTGHHSIYPPRNRGSSFQ
ncbi:FMRFamide receptor-like isoform X2 [Tigriopus californicus]|uniref:FMRFamide receptor-like isoform X2 n=1 Tax=Tigriopus californicus TaxID=6832 RepID=UPI0027DA4115|nr:FMRFamide receptor-like isoform X2 [Tigriopus californicus]